MLLYTLLTLHLAGLILMAGTTFIDFVVFKAFWKQFDKERSLSAVILDATAGFGRITGIGGAFLVFTGIGMMVVTHGVLGEQLWFRIKFALVILLIGNNLLGRRRSLKLRKSIAGNSTNPTAEINMARKFLPRYFTFQFLLFISIVLLSVFKFN